MSKQSKKRDKKTYCDYLTDNQWSYQYSVFIESQKDLESIDLAKLYQKIRRRMMRSYPDQPFLCRVQVKDNLPILVMFTTKAIKQYMDLASELSGLHGIQLNILKKKITQSKIKQLAFIISGAHGHRIDRFLKLVRPNRFSILNKSKLIPR